ncbi:MAG: hypothetical protein IKP76_01645 [Bacilli bacterium]|nr:hypothetical protein [Bacilli bacterium]
MTYLLILVFIPVFFVGIVIYLTTVYAYAFNNDLDLVLLLVGLFSTIISSFVILKTFALMEVKNHKLIKLQKKVDAIVNIFSFTLLFIFGVALIISSVKNNMNVGKMIVGIGLVLLYLYVLYYSLFARIITTFKISDITKYNKVYLISLENKELGIREVYVKDKSKYKKGSEYNCSYSVMFNDIVKIKEEIKEDK